MQKDDMKNVSTGGSNTLLAAAALWWERLSVLKRELYIGRHYCDDTPDADKINTLYKMYCRHEIKVVCKKTWITLDNRLVFQFGKEYSLCKSSDISVKGENGIVMGMNENKYHEYFE